MSKNYLIRIVWLSSQKFILLNAVELLEILYSEFRCCLDVFLTSEIILPATSIASLTPPQGWTLYGYCKQTTKDNAFVSQILVSPSNKQCPSLSRKSGYQVTFIERRIE